MVDGHQLPNPPTTLQRFNLAAALCQKSGARVVLGGVELPTAIRLYLVSGGGVGKSTNMVWLETTLNCALEGSDRRISIPPQEVKFAVLLAAQDLKGKDAKASLLVLRDHIRRRVRIAAS
jgi:hypothetical protein